MTKDEALKLALEALELAGGNLCEALHHPKKLQHGIGEPCPAVAKYDKAITAIKEALAQPEQEPVAWRYKILDYFGRPVWTLKTPKTDIRVLESQPLYTTPPQRKPLTDEEIADLYFDKFSTGELKAFARAIEAKLKEKNT